MSTCSVTVIGLGPMGRAMAGRQLDAGHHLTVWNRTPARAAELVARGARLADSPEAAIGASEVVILSLTDYHAMYEMLGSADREAFRGRTLVNLSSGTPDETRRAAQWAADRGAGFLAGGVMVPAPMVGTEEASVYYSGPQHRLEEHRAVLELIGRPIYLGEDPGLAPLMYLAQLDVFLTSLSSLAHGTALLTSAGLRAADVVPQLMTMIRSIPEILSSGGEDIGEMMDAGEHPGDLSTIIMMGATTDHIVDASTAAGIETGLPKAVQSHYRRAIEDGHGKDNWTRIIDGIRNPA